MIASTIISVGKTVGTGVASVVKSNVVKKLSLSAAVGAAGLIGQKGCEKMITKGKTMQKKAEGKRKDKIIKSWEGMSCEDLI